MTLSLRILIFPLICLLVTTYFIFHSIQGNRGLRRMMQINEEIVQAQKFAATSYHGVFQFVRYVEKLKDNEMDLGEASTVQALDAVKIMTIHKSKGLEFHRYHRGREGAGQGAQSRRRGDDRVPLPQRLVG